MNEIFKSLKKNKRRFIIGGICLVIAGTIAFKPAGISASDVPEDAAAELQPETVATDTQQITLGDALLAADQGTSEPQQVAGDDATAVGSENADAGNAEQNSGKSEELNIQENGEGTANIENGDSADAGDQPVITDNPNGDATSDETPIPVETIPASPEPVQSPDMAVGLEAPAAGPQETAPIKIEAELLRPDELLANPNTEAVGASVPAPMEQEIAAKAQPSNDLDNGSGKSAPVMFPKDIIAKGDKSTMRMTSEEMFELMQSFPDDVSIERKMVVLKAYALQGKVGYFWGGKSAAIGWDDRWGNPAYVTSAGSKTTGTLREFGLDCSGYVTWVFNNSAGKDVSDIIAHGSTNQWVNSTETTFEDAKPGDLAFFAPPGVRSINHVGIVIGKDEEGRMLIAHCSSSRNGVVITEAYASGFRYLRTPNIFENEEYLNNAKQQIATEEVGFAYCWMNSEESSWEAAVEGDLVFKFGPDQEDVAQHDTAVIRRIDEDGSIWISKMPYNATSEVIKVDGEGYQYVRKLNQLDGDGRSIMVKPDEEPVYTQDDFVMMQP